MNGELCMSLMVCGTWELGVANLKDFTVYRRRQEKRRDFILNPLWVHEQFVKFYKNLLKPMKIYTYNIFNKN